MDVSFHFSSINAQDYDCWVIWSVHVSFCHKLPNYFLESLYHFRFPPVVLKTWFLMSSHLVLQLFFNFNYSHRYVVVSSCVLIYISLIANDINHLFIWVFAIHISSLVKCLFFCPLLKTELFFIVEFWEFSFFSRYKPFVWYIIGKYVLPSCSLHFHLLNIAFDCAKVFSCDEFQF